MKLKLKYLLPIFLLSACAGNTRIDENPPDLFENPEIFSLPVKDEVGYSEDLIINSIGDTIITGKTLTSHEVMVPKDSIEKPEVVPYTPNPISTIAHPETKTFPEPSASIGIELENLKKIELGEGNQDFHLINDAGDTLPTNEKIAAIKNVYPAKMEFFESPPFNVKKGYSLNLVHQDFDESLPFTLLTKAFNDSKNNFWFLTNKGLVKYNGREFIYITNPEHDEQSTIGKIVEDKNGNIWFGSQHDGLTKFDGKTFTCYSIWEDHQYSGYRNLILDSKDNFWFEDGYSGLCKFDGSHFTYFTEKEGFPSSYINCIKEDQLGNIWMGTSKEGLFRFDGTSLVNITTENGLSGNHISVIEEDQNGRLWFGTRGNGLSVFDGNTIKQYKNEIPSSIHSILFDASASMWLIGGDFEVVSVEGDIINSYNLGDKRFARFVNSIANDKQGNIWFSGSFLAMHSPNKFKNTVKEEGLIDVNVNSIVEDKNGEYWFTTQSYGATLYNGISYQSVAKEQGLSSDHLLSLYKNKEGDIWFGTNMGGACKYDGENFEHYKIEQGLSNLTITDIIETKEGDVWFASHGGGLTRFDGENYFHFNDTNSLSSNIIWSMLEDSKGNLWFGTEEGGLSKYSNGEFIHYTTNEGLINNHIWTVIEDQQGNIWCGTHKGLSKFDGNSFSNFSKDQGLPGLHVLSLIEDETGNIWLGTNEGLCVITPLVTKEQTSQPLNAVSYQIRSFRRSDGLDSDDFTMNATYIDSKKNIWWGNGEGIVSLNLNSFSLSDSIATPSINRIEINEVEFNTISAQSSDIVDTYEGVHLFDFYPLNLVLPHDKNHITFHYSTIDWNSPRQIRYSFRLIGLDNNWSKPSKEGKADFRNLPYGEFTFELKAIGESRTWSKSFKYNFKILPPWWHTWWARTLYGIVTFLSIFLIVRSRTAKLNKRQAELETEVTNATKEILQQKEILEEAHKEITDSINYAERIQRSFLATEELLTENLGEHFVYFNPKEAVSGDFYWAGKLADGNFAVSCADSTGHGVPGAIMSILNISSIEKAVENKASKPAEIFNQARKLIIDRLKKDGSPEGGKDGMDASLISFNPEKRVMQYVAAHNPIWIIRAGELIDIKAEKMPVGKHDHDHIPFEGGEFELQKGDIIYTLTDGYQDQFGGEKGKKYKVKPFKRLLLDICELSMQEQHQKISDTFDQWKRDLEQVDDVCVIGIKV